MGGISVNIGNILGVQGRNLGYAVSPSTKALHAGTRPSGPPSPGTSCRSSCISWAHSMLGSWFRSEHHRSCLSDAPGRITKGYYPGWEIICYTCLYIRTSVYIIYIHERNLMHTVFEVCVCARMCVCIVLCCVVLYCMVMVLVFVLVWYLYCIGLVFVLYWIVLYCTVLYVWMYVCMDGWMDGWMDVCMQYQQVLPRDPRFFSLDLFWWV